MCCYGRALPLILEIVGGEGCATLAMCPTGGVCRDGNVNHDSFAALSDPSVGCGATKKTQPNGLRQARQTRCGGGTVGTTSM